MATTINSPLQCFLFRLACALRFFSLRGAGPTTNCVLVWLAGLISTSVSQRGLVKANGIVKKVVWPKLTSKRKTNVQSPTTSHRIVTRTKPAITLSITFSRYTSSAWIEVSKNPLIKSIMLSHWCKPRSCIVILTRFRLRLAMAFCPWHLFRFSPVGREIPNLFKKLLST